MKRLIKYAALLFALILAASIIGGCLSLGVSLVHGLQDELSYRNEFDGDNNNGIWYRDDNGDVIFLGMHFGNSSGEVKSGSEQFSAEEITSLDIHVGSAELIVEVSDGDVIYVEYENIPVEYEFYIDDETLVIDKEDRINFVWNVSFTEMPKIHVSVPATKVFDKVNVDKGSGSAKLIGLLVEDCNIDNGSGGLGISNVTAEELSVDSGSGGVNISDTKAKKSVFDSGSGSFIVKNCELGETSMDSGSGTVMMEDIIAKNMRTEAGSGRVEISGILTGKCDFESGSGSMSVVVYGNEDDYNYRTDMGSGSFYLNGKKAEKNYNKDDKRAQYLLTFDAGSGRVSLEFDASKTVNVDTTLENIPEVTPENTQNNTQNGGSYER